MPDLDPNDPALKPPQAPPPGWTPPDASPAPPPQPSGGAVETYLRESGAYTDPAEINYQRASAEAERTKIEGQEAGAVDRNMHRREQLLARPIGAPPDPKLRDIPQRPQLQYQDAMKTFQSPAVLLATLGSLFTRRPAVNALTAGAEAIKGYMEGDKEKIEREEKNWKNSVEQVVKQNEVELEKYNAQWKRTNLSVTERAAQIQGLAAANQDQVLLAAIRSGHPERVEQIFAARQAANDRLAQTIVGIKGKEDFLKTGLIPEDTLNFMADQVIAGDKSPYSNMGTGLQKAENLERLRTTVMQKAKERGLQGGDLARINAEFEGLKSGQRSLGTRLANMTLIDNEVNKAVPAAMQASDAVQRGKWVPVNKLIQEGKVITSDPQLKAFAVANLQLAELWARSMNPTGVMRVEDRNLALENLSIATGPEAWKAAVKMIQTAIQRNKQAAQETRTEMLQGGDLDRSPGAAPPPQGNSAPATGGGGGWSIQKVQ